MLKVVLDSNIFVSFLISHQPPISTILNLWARGELTICYSSEILDETEAALRYPKIRELISSLEAESLINAVKVLGVLVIPTKKIEVCRDKKDNKYLEAALASESKYLISGDKDLLVLSKFEGITILSPNEFLKSKK